MAQRRMISDKVIKTDSFMEMPHSTKNLYFYLMMEADDDGFVSNPKTIMRMVNAVDDDYKILVGKRFVVPFESGVCVIKHWLIHNLIRADRKVDTQWSEEKKLLVVDPDTQKYSLDKGLQPSDNQMTTKCPHRLGKVRLGKVKEQPTPKRAFGEFKKVLLTEVERDKFISSYGHSQAKTLLDELDQYVESTGKKYQSHYATLLAWARRKKLAKVIAPVANITETDRSPEEIQINIDRAKKVRESLNLR